MKTYEWDVSIYNGIAKNLLDGVDYKEFYNYATDDNSHLLDRKDKLKKMKYDRNGLAEALLKFNKEIGNGEESIKNIEKLRSDNTYVVVTGQQSGYFSGPLYTIYKAMTTIKLAKKYSEILGSDVVPVFWVASEDHDFHEVSKVVYSYRDKLKKTKFRHKSDNSQSIGNIEIDKLFVEEMNSKMIDIVGDEKFKEIFLKNMKIGESFSMWFSRIIASIFSDYGLVLIDSMMNEKRILEKEFFVKAIKNNDDIRQSFFNKTELLKKKGFSTMIEYNEKSSNLFIQHNKDRVQLYKNGDTFYNENYNLSYSVEELINIANDTPEKFSTNVVLRPVVQDFVLPNLAYVAGPGEMKYYSQLKDVYGVFSQEMPIIFPRENFTFIDSAFKKTIDKYNLDLDDVLRGSKEYIIKNYLTRITENRIDEIFGQFNDKIFEAYNGLITEIGYITEVKEELINSNKNHIDRQLEYLKKKVEQNLRKENKESISEISSCVDFIAPDGNLQERSHSLISVMNNRNEILEHIFNEELKSQHRIIIS